jgi:hypothetical protein
MAIWFCGAKMCPAAVGLINTLITFNNHVDVAKKDSMCVGQITILLGQIYLVGG